MPTLFNSSIDNIVSKGITTITDRGRSPIVKKLLESKEPSIQWKIRVKVLGEDPKSKPVKQLQDNIRKSKRVKLLLSERNKKGEIPFHPYKKWCGSHWVLSLLADLGYPAGDKSLLPLREQTYQWLLPEPDMGTFKNDLGQKRLHGSIEGNLIYSLLTLGLADDRIEILANRLIKSQWQDGGWNCDRDPKASHSSFTETILPLRGLYLYAKASGNPKAHRAVERAAEVFLQRHLYRRKTNSAIIDKKFLLLHYPLYWHYDILHGLKVMAETLFIHDTRCADALDLLQEKRLPDGGYPAEDKYYNHTPSHTSSFSLVDWGPINKRNYNEFITADALSVLASAGR